MQSPQSLDLSRNMPLNSVLANEFANRFTVSETNSSDVEPIVKIAKSLGVFTPDELNCLREDIDAFLSPDSDPDKLYTAKIDGKIAGFIHYGPLPITDRAMMLFWILVAPEFRSTGVAKFLMDMMEQDIRSEDCRILFIETSDNETFEPAKRFYQKNGYKLACVIPDYYEENHGKAVFSKLF